MRRMGRSARNLAAIILCAGAIGAAGYPSEALTYRPQGSISLIATATNQVIATVHIAGAPSQLIVSPGAASAYVLAWTPGTSRVYKITSGPAATARRIAVTFSPRGMAMAPNGRYLYLAKPSCFGRGCGPGSIVPVRTATGKPGRPIGLRWESPDVAGPMAVSPDGAVLYAAAGDGDGVIPVNLATSHVGRTIPLDGAVKQMLLSRTGRRLYVLSIDGQRGRLTEVNTATRRVVGQVSVPGQPQDMAVTPDGKLVYVTSGETTVTAVRTAPLTVAKRIKVTYPMAVAVTPDGRTAYVTGISGVTAISTKTNAAKPPIAIGSGQALSIAISPSGQWAYIYEFNNVVPLNLVTRVAGVPVLVGPQGVAGSAVEAGGIGFTANGKLAYVIDETTSS